LGFYFPLRAAARTELERFDLQAQLLQGRAEQLGRLVLRHRCVLLPAKNATLLSTFLGLSRACLGKMFVFVYLNGSKNGGFRTA
jgi:hypothetical protein